MRNTQTTPTHYQPCEAADDPEQHKLRVLIDEVATVRGLTIQMAMRVMALVAATSDAERAEVRDEFRVLYTQFRTNIDIVFGVDPPLGDMRKQIEWMRTVAARNDARRADLMRADDSIAAMADVVEAGKVPSFRQAREFFDRNWPIVRDKMTEIIWDLWADLDAQKTAAVDENTALQSTLQTTLDDIKRFSVAIRMIAINSAVLAARPEDAGAGFKTISREVKQLSEEIEVSTSRAQKTISGLL